MEEEREDSEMEKETSKAQRRLDSLLRHLLPQCSHRPHLQPLNLRGGNVLQIEGMPVIFGGMVLDIHASPSIRAIPRSTTPGKVDYFLGGVARNIAECLSKLGIPSFMISAVGLDMAGSLLLDDWRSAGLPIEGIQQEKDITTAVVCNMFDNHGELVAGVASVESIERFVTPQWIEKFKSNVRFAPVVMIDANLSPPALQAVCQMAAESSTPVWFEPVSVAKSRRVASIAKSVTFASPNEVELMAMSNALSHGNPFGPMQIDQHETNHSSESLFRKLKPAIVVLLENGIKFVLLTVGPKGAFLCSRDGLACMEEDLNTLQLGPDITPSGPNNHVRPRSQFLDRGKLLYDMVTSKCPSRQDFESMCRKGKRCLSVVHFPALSVSVKRVSGAGDCLVGGVLAALCSGLNIMQSVAVGCAAARGSIEVESNVPSVYDLKAVADDASWVYSAAKVMFHESFL